MEGMALPALVAVDRLDEFLAATTDTEEKGEKKQVVKLS